MTDAADRTEFLSPERERELVEQATSGDRDALGKLLHAHRPVIKAAVKPFRGSGWESDLYTVATLALWEAWEDFDPESGRFGGFARTVVRRRVLDAVRRFYGEDRPKGDEVDRLGRLVDPDDPDSSLLYETIEEDAGGPEEWGQREGVRQRATEVVAALLMERPEMLSANQRYAVIAILDLDGNGHRTPEDVAATLDTRPDSVRRSLARASEKIHRALEAGDYADPFRAVDEEAPDERIVDPFAQVGGSR